MKILEMNKEKSPSLLDFYCNIEYSTLAHQRIIYIYQIKISNDKQIENIKDNINDVKDENNSKIIKPTIFRSLQDYISGIDRNNYYWEKMGQAQMRGIMVLYNADPMQQATNKGEASEIENEKAGVD
jgi:hypothetical protein